MSDQKREIEALRKGTELALQATDGIDFSEKTKLIAALVLRLDCFLDMLETLLHPPMIMSVEDVERQNLMDNQKPGGVRFVDKAARKERTE